jgi:broad specificity phosphatase PhoE
MRLIFIRHAQSTGNFEGRLQGHAEFDLSDAGRLQAEKLYARLGNEELVPTHVYSSPLRRTADTAKLATRSWPVSIEYRDDLREHDIGVFSGLTWDEIAEKYPDMAESYHTSRNWDVVEGAEKEAERHARGLRVIETTIKRHSNDDVVMLFTHGGILQHIVAALMGTSRTWGIPVQNTGIFDFSLDTELWHQDGDGRLNHFLWRIHRFNDASHLMGE